MIHPFLVTVREYDELASTSDTARELVEAGTVELPLLVITKRQTAGRGRGENRWWSDSGSLTFSLAFDPTSRGIRREREPRIALAAAVAIVRACSSFAPLGIRWPNDIECQGKKLGGLLPESLSTPFGPRFVLGIGLNLTTNLADAPEEVRAMATSLHVLGISPDRGSIISAIFDRFSEALAQLAADDPALPQAWAALDQLRGQTVRLKLGAGCIEGVGAGIAADGGLILRTDSGSRHFHAGQVLRDPA